MELHTPDGQGLVLDSHDLALGGLGGNFQTGWQGIPLDNQAMVARGRKGIGHSGKKIATIVLNRRNLAMHHAIVHHHLGAKRVTYALVAQTNAKHGNTFAGKGADNVIGQSRFSRRTGSGRN